MSKNKNKKKKKGGYKPPMQSPQDIIETVVAVATQIFELDDAGPLWGELHKAFLKSEVDSSVVAKIIMHKDKERFQRRRRFIRGRRLSRIAYDEPSNQ